MLCCRRCDAPPLRLRFQRLYSVVRHKAVSNAYLQRSHLYISSLAPCLTALRHTECCCGSWTLFSPDEYRKLCPYPRVHPMWAKSRTDLASPDLDRCPALKTAASLVPCLAALLLPGCCDEPFVSGRRCRTRGFAVCTGAVADSRAAVSVLSQPFWWHHVVSTSASASLTSYSRHHAVYDHMHAVYRSV